MKVGGFWGLILRVDTGDWSGNGGACFMYLMIRCCLKKIYEYIPLKNKL